MHPSVNRCHIWICSKKKEFVILGQNMKIVYKKTCIITNNNRMRSLIPFMHLSHNFDTMCAMCAYMAFHRSSFIVHFANFDVNFICEQKKLTLKPYKVHRMSYFYPIFGYLPFAYKFLLMSPFRSFYIPYQPKRNRKISFSNKQ